MMEVGTGIGDCKVLLSVIGNIRADMSQTKYPRATNLTR
jgi:hypothetical protein